MCPGLHKATLGLHAKHINMHAEHTPSRRPFAALAEPFVLARRPLAAHLSRSAIFLASATVSPEEDTCPRIASSSPDFRLAILKICASYVSRHTSRYTVTSCRIRLDCVMSKSLLPQVLDHLHCHHPVCKGCEGELNLCFDRNWKVTQGQPVIPGLG